MTDETRLHGMMADPGSAPDHDANGWPVRGEQTTARPVEYGDRVLHVQLGLGWVRVRGTATDRALVVFDKGSAPGEWLPVESLIVVPQDGDPYTAVADAVAGGTAGLAELLARLQAEVQSLADMAQAAADVVEGQRRELWDAVVHSARCAEHPGGLPGKDFSRTASTLQYAYRVIAGLDGPELERLLAAELDSRYGKDRAKGGGPS